MGVSGAEAGEQVSHTKERPAGKDNKCRVRSEAFQSRAGDVSVAMGKVDGPRANVKPNSELTQQLLREPWLPLHHALPPERGAVHLLAAGPCGDMSEDVLTTAQERQSVQCCQGRALEMLTRNRSCCGINV